MEKKKRMKIAIVDDHKLFRDGLKSMIKGGDDLVVVGEAGDGQAAIRMVRSARPDLLLLDLSMPKLGGLSVLKDLKKEFPALKILVLTFHESDKEVGEVFEAGADGYCVKTDRWEELLLAIHEVIEGNTYISPSIAGNVLGVYMEGRKNTQPAGAWESVTPREQEVLKLLARGYKSKDIAKSLSISIKTVKTHRNNIMNKLDLHNAAALAAYAIKKGMAGNKSRRRKGVL